MNLVVRAFPVLEGKEEGMERFAEEAAGRAAELAEFYGRYGVQRETWHVQSTVHGTWVIGVTQLGARPAEEVAPEYAASQVEFDQWFKARVHDLTGINPDSQPLGPPTRCILDWHA